MRCFALLILTAVILLTQGCSLKYKKYHADWIVSSIVRNDIDKTHLVGSYNFKIHHGNKKAYLPGLYLDDSGFIHNHNSPIEFFSSGGIHHLDIKENDFFKGVYQLKCINQNCCSLILTNDTTRIQLEYNGDLPYNRTRPCPKVTFPNQ